jgi:hypothetical protein
MNVCGLVALLLVFIAAALAALLFKRTFSMATSPEMQDLQTAVAAEDSVIESAILFIKGFAAMVEANAGDKAALLALTDDAKARADALAAAIATPPTTPT